jgi:hypothetical protein
VLPAVAQPFYDRGQAAEMVATHTVLRIVVTATGADGSVTRWYPDLQEGREAQTIALPADTRAVTLERPRRVRIHLGQLRAGRRRGTR